MRIFAGLAILAAVGVPPLWWRFGRLPHRVTAG